MEGPVQAQVLVEDVVGDAALELLVADDDGHVVLMTSTGKQVWSRHIFGVSPTPPCIGDVDGDGVVRRAWACWVLHFPA